MKFTKIPMCQTALVLLAFICIATDAAVLKANGKVVAKQQEEAQPQVRPAQVKLAVEPKPDEQSKKRKGPEVTAEIKGAAENQDQSKKRPGAQEDVRVEVKKNQGVKKLTPIFKKSPPGPQKHRKDKNKRRPGHNKKDAGKGKLCDLSDHTLVEFVLDSSNSITNKTFQIVKHMIGLVPTIVSHGHFGLVTFGTSAKLRSEISLDTVKFLKNLESTPYQGTTTNCAAGVEYGVDQAAKANTRNKYLVFVSDGHCSARHPINAVLQRAKRNRITNIAVGVGKVLPSLLTVASDPSKFIIQRETDTPLKTATSIAKLLCASANQKTKKKKKNRRK